MTDAYGWDSPIFQFDPERQREPRPYQQDAIEAALPVLKRKKRFLLSLATGGGKTWTAWSILQRWNDEKHTGPRTKPLRVLWLAPNWQLLDQACAEFCQGWEGARDVCTRIGGKRKTVLPDRGRRPDTRVWFTTLHTLSRRLKNDPDELRTFDVMVVDECHWASGAKLGPDVIDFATRERGAVLGLSATPSDANDKIYDERFDRTFATLVGQGYLAQPIVHPTRCVSAVEWTPAINNNLITRDSLTPLLKSEERDEIIVEFVHRHRRRLGKMLVFTGTIEHANRLAAALGAHGEAARAVHSHNPPAVNRQYLAELRAGRVTCLVGVDMFARGTDLPDVEAVVMAVPTASARRYMQMVGRGARIAEGKHAFHIIDVVDNARTHGELLFDADRFLEDVGLAARHRPYTRPNGTALYPFDPAGTGAWLDDEHDEPALSGLWIRNGQSFGVEFELTRDGFEPGEMPEDWYDVGRALADRLREELPDEHVYPAAARYGHTEYDGWQVTWDSTAGWEVVSPPLEGEDGLLRLVRACDALDELADELGLRVNHRTGLHVHLGWAPATGPQDERDDELLRAMRLARRFEGAAATMVGPSRVWHFEGGRYDTEAPNEYCLPMAAHFDLDLLLQGDVDAIRDALSTYDARYTAVNFVRELREDDHATVEIRLHSGTTDGAKVALWISLWQQILFAARDTDVFDDLKELEDGDVIELEPLLPLVEAYLPAGNLARGETCLARLEERVEELEAGWERAAQRRLS